MSALGDCRSSWRPAVDLGPAACAAGAPSRLGRPALEDVLGTYDPGWEARWECADAALKAFDRGNGAASAREPLLLRLHEVYVSQFETVQDVVAHDMRFVHVPAGIEVADPHFPAGLSLSQAKARIAAFRADVQAAVARKRRPAAADPPGLAAFTEPPRPGSQRIVERLTFSLPGSCSAFPCTLIMEATPHDLHVCFAAVARGSRITNNIELLANHVYAMRFASQRGWKGLVARWAPAAGRPSYRPCQVTFYEYAPAWSEHALSSGEDFSSVRMEWTRSRGFHHPAWDRHASTPAFLMEAAEPPPPSAIVALPALRHRPPQDKASANAGAFQPQGLADAVRRMLLTALPPVAAGCRRALQSVRRRELQGGSAPVRAHPLISILNTQEKTDA